MYSKVAALSILLAFAEARFGQEGLVQNAIQGLGEFGNPGEAATLAGSTPGVLLGAADPCDKLRLADTIVSSLGDDPKVIAGAAALVQSEQNFNPFGANALPNICGDASLPATEALRGIVPLVDPAVDGADVENANAAKSLTSPFDATGKSVADIMKENNFSNFNVKGGAGGNAGGNAGAGGNNNNAGGNNTNNNNAGGNNNNAGGNNNNNNNNNNNGGGNDTVDCGGSNNGNDNNNDANDDNAADDNNNAGGNNNNNNNNNNNAGGNNNNNGGGAAAGQLAAGAGAVENAVTGNFKGFEASSKGLDFGSCVPTLKFEESLNGRKAGESTFQAVDPKVNKGQQEALNPAIIMRRICDQLGNVCQADAAAVAACRAAEQKLGTGAKDATTADAWNTELGFAGADINPDNAPKAGLIGHT